MPGSQQDNPQQVELGRKLFFSRSLSASRQFSCNTCHQLRRAGGTYNPALSPAAARQMNQRDSPTVLNAGFQVAQFWDGRAADLETQAREPMLNPEEMGMSSEAELLNHLKHSRKFQKLFASAYPEYQDPVTLDHVTHAIAAYERTLITHDQFDEFLSGQDRALSRRERKGLETFLQVGCQKCHNGPLLGGNSFKRMGIYHPYANTNDVGRVKITGDEQDRYVFKVASLRNVGLTSPYFHDGQMNSLEEAIRQMAFLQLDKQLSNDEVRSIRVFLLSLSGKRSR